MLISEKLKMMLNKANNEIMKSMEIYQHISMEIIICFSFFIYNFDNDCENR